MIPKLLDSTQSLTSLVNDKSEGLGRLIDVTSCKVTEERNGAYTLEMRMPSSGKLFNEIALGGLIQAKANQMDAPQIFRIVKITKPVNGVCTIYANHITYDLSKTSVLPFKATGAANAVKALKANMLSGEAFNISTDIDNASTTMENTLPQSFRSLLGGQSGSLLDLFGGEYQWDNLNVKLVAHRGSDHGVKIAYGKNLTDLKQEENIESMYTAVLPYVIVDDSAIIGDLQTIMESSEPRIMNLDLTNEFPNILESTPTKAEINAKAQSYINANNLAEPKISLTVSFVNLADTVEYKNMAMLETVSLCDTVSVSFEKLGIQAKAKVIKTVYDTLNEKYESIEIGNARSTLANTIVNGFNSVNDTQKQASSFLQGLIKTANEKLAGGLGGHMVINRADNGEPNELLFMDTDDKTTAKNVLRINMNGIAFSSNGYNGDYKTAWTLDGKFIADFIGSGTIKAVNIEGSTITGGTISGSKLTGGTITGGEVNGAKVSGSEFIFNVNDEHPVRLTEGRYGVYDNTEGKMITTSCARISGLGSGSAEDKKIGFAVNGSFSLYSQDLPCAIATSNDHNLNLFFGSNKRQIDNRVPSQGMAGLYIANDTANSNYIGLFDQGGIYISTESQDITISSFKGKLKLWGAEVYVNGKKIA